MLTKVYVFLGAKLKLIFEKVDVPFFPVFVLAFKLCRQIKRHAPQYRDSIYHKSGTTVDVLPKDVHEYLKFADWAYDHFSLRCYPSLAAALKSHGYQLLRQDKTEAPGHPCHYIAVNHDKMEVLVSIRGTNNIGDALVSSE